MTPLHPRLGAIAVLIRGEDVLLVQRDKQPDAGLWGFPGGHVELGETALDAAARELREETGLVAEPIEYLTNVDVLRHDDEGRVAVHFLLAAVLCELRGSATRPRARDDARDARWIACDTARAGRLPLSAQVLTVMDLALDRVQARIQARRAMARP